MIVLSGAIAVFIVMRSYGLRCFTERSAGQLLSRLSVFLCVLCRPVACVEPLTALFTAGGAVLLGSGIWNNINDAVYTSGVSSWIFDLEIYKKIDCSLRECCSDRDIPSNMNELRRKLSSEVHGQHLLSGPLVDIITSHIANEAPRKPLVLSFHGSTGVGKNYVAKYITDSIYLNGFDSRFVHLFVGSMDFPLDDSYHVKVYANQLRQWVEGNLTACPRSLFIFDEVDKFPAGVLDSVKPYMDYYEKVRGTVLSKAIFLLLSNTGGKIINTLVLKHWHLDLPREQLSLKMFEDAISEGAFSETGGLYRSHIVSSALIDFYMPFLPLQREHVRLCVRDEFVRRGKLRDNLQKIDEVMDMIKFDQQIGEFAKSGCKDVANKVNLVIDAGVYG